jgi:hypothetical protein
MSKIEELLTEATQALAELVTVAERNADGVSAAAIEQALAELAGTLRKTMQADSSAIVDAIKGMGLTVNVSPTPLEIIIPPAPVAAPAPFRPLLMKVLDYNAQGRIQTVEIFEKGSK